MPTLSPFPLLFKQARFRSGRRSLPFLLVGSGVLWAAAVSAQVNDFPTPVTIGGTSPALANLELAEVRASSLRVPLLLQQIAAGKANAEELLKAGALKKEDLMWAVRHPRLWQVGTKTGEETTGATQVYDAFLAHWGEEVAGAVSWDEPARSALATELSRRGDARCVPLFEAMTREWVAKWKAEGAQKIQGAVPGLHALAWFYQGKGESLKAAQTYEKSAEYSMAPAWVGSALVEAARLYLKAGQKEKSDELYAQVPQAGYGWGTALAYYDQALPLIGKGKFTEAREILSQPLNATVDQDGGAISQNYWLASLSYQQGDLEETMRYSQLAIRAVSPDAKLSNITTGLYQQAQTLYNRAGGWKTQPIQSEVKSLVLTSNPPQINQPLYARFRIKTYGDITVKASFDTPALQVRVLPVDKWQQDTLGAKEEESEVIVEVPADFQGANKEQKFILTLQSAARVAKPTLVSVVVKAKDQNG